ncbi:bifunctional folylpolyglutamate synthase/dihydrofolate synthase [Ornithinibacillus gellani]|uniref:bifunctional folylpolyglutamate synthase/dihydrofolate synthase n=1 Tax=Ornithinibacillus gellani TaxID=2293253 RepID=UPI0011AB34F0|nr:Mur ligase family protein [Ornithinibacillus gellani]TQS76109.1 bifunctional folylpolyglutamate synthase/dihydrofolate synthase [Ornithinibacillus gellani]
METAILCILSDYRKSGAVMIVNYQEACSFFENRKNYGIKPGLERMVKLLESLGNPQHELQAVHVAGTNGKGSTVAFMQHALRANGYITGQFTSPSLSGLTGHILVNGQAVTEDVFLDLLEKVIPHVMTMDKQDNHPTEFEILTAMAFLHFSNSVDIALVEAGMGGLEDTTNCMQPILSIISNVALDHTAFLGSNVAEIARHKAGIIKENVPVVWGEMDDSAAQIIKETTVKLHADSYHLGEDFLYTQVVSTNDVTAFTWNNQTGDALDVMIKMPGLHQVKNAALALQGLKLLEQLGYRNDWQRTLEAFRITALPGRFEKVHKKPLIIIDGAHNPAGMSAFLAAVEQGYHDKEKHLIFAGFSDKDLKHMLQASQPFFHSITLTTFAHERAASIQELSRFIEGKGILKDADWLKVLQTILANQHRSSEAVYFFAGSLHFIKLVRTAIVNQTNKSI